KFEVRQPATCVCDNASPVRKSLKYEFILNWRKNLNLKVSSSRFESKIPKYRLKSFHAFRKRFHQSNHTRENTSHNIVNLESGGIVYKSYIKILILALSLLTITACSSTSTANKTLIISAIPDQDPAVLQQLYDKLAAYLGQQLGVTVQYQASETYDTAID